MIRLFSSNETAFDHFETVLVNVLSFQTEEEENGIYYCEMTCPLDERIEEGKIIKAPTPRGEQLFRIIKVHKNVPAMTLYVYGRHISYDLLDNFLLNIRPTNKTQNNALADILAGAEYAHPFSAQSDVPGLATANYVRQNPIQAIMGTQENSALNLWGGFLRRDNFLLKVLATSPDKNYEVRFGKNLIGVDEELDMTEVVTRFYPTVVIEDPTVTALPEKYVDSPLINNYPYPIIKELRVELTDEEKALPIASIYTIMRERCAAQFALKADQPKVNYKVNFVELRKTEQYKHMAVLEELDISDTAWVYISPLNLSMSARMIKYRHDGLNDRYLNMELGNFKPKLTTQKTEFKKLVEDATRDLTDGVITAMLKEAVDRIQGNLGGNVVTITNNGKPVATAYMDTDDVTTANEYVIINNKGIAFGVNGLNNPPELAIDIDGSIIGDSAFFRSITTNLIQSELGSDLVLSSNTSIKLLANSLVTVDENGITTGIAGNSMVSRQSYDGFRVLDGSDANKTIISVTNGGVDGPVIKADQIYSPSIVRRFSGIKTVFVSGSGATGDGTGRDASNKADNIAQALDTVLDGATSFGFGYLTVQIDGAVTEMVRLDGFTGVGTITFQGGRINGYINVTDTSLRVDIKTIIVARLDGSLYGLINAINSRDIRLNGVQLDGAGVGYGIAAYYGSCIYAENCDLVKFERAYQATANAIITQQDCKGTSNNFVASADLGGVINMTGTRPIGTNLSRTETEGRVYSASSTPLTSAFSVSPAIWGVKTATFTADLSRYNVPENWTTAGKFAQGKSPTTGTSYKGYAKLGSRIRDWLQSNGGYQNLQSPVITASRDSLWGSGAVSLKFDEPYDLTLPAVSQGGTSSATAGPLLTGYLETSGAAGLNTSTLLTSDYAGYSKITVKVTAEKKV